MNPWLLRIGVAACLCGAGCRSKTVEQAEAPLTPAASPTSSRAALTPPPPPPAKPSDLDRAFRAYRDKLPGPATLSESNGFGLRCDRHGSVTYTLLTATADKLPVRSDADLPLLVPWARDVDPCIRQIALDAIVKGIHFDPNRLVVPSMHDPEHYKYHEIMVSLEAYLSSHAITHDPELFAGLMVNVTDKDFSMLHGKWEQPFDKGLNFHFLVELDADTLRITQKQTRPDPKWPDHTWTMQVEKGRVNAQRQFVAAARSSVESDANGFQGQKVEPSDRVFSFWPVSADVVWFDDAFPGSWKKLRRVGK